eukprot:TRINITY_DN2601_c0_g1_i2.p1 TRINITY_DN2601_c0_g1~~TRINITY_DN2601_c0_g1_i2.p1  ORF type:complete len:664 (-),score=199.63 TRINITY_DN2601_c0_g1_i2:26-1813(-)
MSSSKAKAQPSSGGFQEVVSKKKSNKIKSEASDASTSGADTDSTHRKPRPPRDQQTRPTSSSSKSAPHTQANKNTKPKPPRASSKAGPSTTTTGASTKNPPTQLLTSKQTPSAPLPTSDVIPSAPTALTTTSVATPSTAPPATSQAKVSSWSQLFVPPPSATSKAPPASSSSKSSSSNNNNNKPPSSSSSSASASTPKTKESLPLAMLIDESKFTTLISPPKGVSKDGFQPRGLVNKGNTCFLNSILQSLIACEPFYNMLFYLQNRKLPASMPTLDSFLEFLKNYETITPQQKTVSIFDRTPLYPSDFEAMLIEFDKTTRSLSESLKAATLSSSSSAAVYQQKQEDAQEFMCYILNKLHDEMLRVSKTSKKASKEKEDIHIEEWAEVGKKNKTNSVVEMEYVDTPITRLFGIYLRSFVKKKGAKASVNVEPSLCLSLDIEPSFVRSVEDALEFFMSPERLEGVTCSKTELEVQASKQMTIEKLPRILILQLKRFSYSLSAAGRKIEKFVSFPKSLNLSAYLSAGKGSSTTESCTYSLRSVISHHGGSLSNGHYTCDVLQPNGDWLEFDDNIIQRVPLKSVQNRQAYLLLYCRSNH